MRKKNAKVFEAFEMWILWRRMVGVSWTKFIRNEEILQNGGWKRITVWNNPKPVTK